MRRRLQEMRGSRILRCVGACMRCVGASSAFTGQEKKERVWRALRGGRERRARPRRRQCGVRPGGGVEGGCVPPPRPEIQTCDPHLSDSDRCESKSGFFLTPSFSSRPPHSHPPTHPCSPSPAPHYYQQPITLRAPVHVLGHPLPFWEGEKC